MENSNLNTYLKLKEAGVGELSVNEDGSFSASYLPYDSITGLQQEITTITLSREDLMSQKNQLLTQLSMRDEELGKIQTAKENIQAQIAKIDAVLADMDQISPPMPPVIVMP